MMFIEDNGSKTQSNIESSFKSKSRKPSPADEESM